MPREMSKHRSKIVEAHPKPEPKPTNTKLQDTRPGLRGTQIGKD